MSTPSARPAAPPADLACCAHCTVKWITYFVQDTNGQTSGYWACSDCGKRFAPIQDEGTPLPPPQARTSDEHCLYCNAKSDKTPCSACREREIKFLPKWAQDEIRLSQIRLKALEEESRNHADTLRELQELEAASAPQEAGTRMTALKDCTCTAWEAGDSQGFDEDPNCKFHAQAWRDAGRCPKCHYTFKRCTCAERGVPLEEKK